MKTQNKVVLMVGTSMNTKGGIATVVRSYNEFGIMRDLNIHYITSHVDGGKLKKLIVFLRGLFEFVFCLVKYDVDIVHVHSSLKASFFRKSVFIVWSKLFGKKVVFHLHSGGFFNAFYDGASLPAKYLIRKIVGITDVVIVLSDQWSSRIRHVFGQNLNLRVLHNSVEIQGEATPKKLSNHSVFLFMGLIRKEKGLGELITAISVLNDALDVELDIAGDGDIDRYLSMSKELEINNIVTFHGWVGANKVDELLKRATVLVLPSYHEGLPMCVLESLSYGVPVVATSVGGLPDVIEDGVNGFLVPAKDCEALSKKLKDMISDDNKYREMSKNALSTIQNSFSIEATKQELESIYLDLRKSAINT